MEHTEFNNPIQKFLFESLIELVMSYRDGQNNIGNVYTGMNKII